MSERYYTISFNNTLYLTSNGLNNGGECRLSAIGQHTFETNYQKTKSVDFRSKVKYLKYAIGLANRELELRIEQLPKDVGDNLLALRADQDANDTEITMQGSHPDFPSFDLKVEIDEIIFGESLLNLWADVVIRVTTYEEVIP